MTTAFEILSGLEEKDLIIITPAGLKDGEVVEVNGEK